MGKFNQIEKKAETYFLYAFANLRENMALRIFHALIPTLVQDIHSSQEIDNIKEFMAFDLIPGAKEIFELGSKAVAYEFDCSSNEILKKEIQNTIAKGNYTKGLELAVTGFLTSFRRATGNEAWSNIAQSLLYLNQLIQKVERTKNPVDALRLSTYLDTIDQLAHNTGSLMEKLVQREMDSVTPETQQRYQELLRLRDISKMEGSYPIALLMQQNLPGMPKEYREWYRRYLAQRTSPTAELDRPANEAQDEYNAALELLRKTKRDREFANYLTVQDDSSTINPVSKKPPPTPPRKKQPNEPNPEPR